MKKTFLALAILLITLKVYATDYYWVNGSGNWNDFSGHWATTSGGNTFQSTSPTYNDNVFFDQYSFLSALNQVTITSDVYCAHFYFDNTLNAEIKCDISSREFQIWGDITINAPFNFSYDGILTVASNSFIKSSATAFNGQLKFNAIGSQINLVDNFISTNSIDLNGIVFNTLDNEFRFNNMILANNYISTLKFGASNVYFSGDLVSSNLSHICDFDSATLFYTDSAVMTLRPDFIHKIVCTNEPGVELKYCDVDSIFIINSSKLIFENGHCQYVNFQGPTGDSCFIGIAEFAEIGFFDGSADSSAKWTMWVNFYSNISKLISAQDCFFSGDNFNGGTAHIDTVLCKKNAEFYYYYPGMVNSQISIDYLEIEGNGIYCYMDCGFLNLHPNTQHIFRNEFAITIDSISAIGLPGQEISFSSDLGGIQDTVIMAKDFCGDYLNISDMYIIGGANYTAGTNSTDAGNNTGWNFNSCLINVDELLNNLNLISYPNPAHEYIYFNEPVDQIRIFDLAGKLILSSQEKGMFSLNIASLKQNYYTIELINKNGSARRKLIVY